MNTSNRDERPSLYQLLPEIYRLRDRDNGQVLQALLAVFDEQFDKIEQDIDALYDDQFIETCAPETIAYIGDLVGARLTREAGRLPTMRSYVGNLVGYRKRKGLAGVLAQVAHGVTGWGVRAGSNSDMLNVVEPLKVYSRGVSGTVDLRNLATIATLHSPDDMSHHTVELRLPRAQTTETVQVGRFNHQAFLIFVYRLGGYPTEWTQPAFQDSTSQCGFFHPFGIDTPLFEWILAPLAQRADTGAERFTVAQPLTRAKLAALLASNPKTLPFVIRGQTSQGIRDFSAEEICVWDLSDWNWNGSNSKILVAVDPELGRFALRSEVAPSSVRISAMSGFSTDMGGGPYDRAHLGPVPNRLFLVGPYREDVDNSGESVISTHGSLHEAIAAWKNWVLQKESASLTATIRVVDSRTYSWGREKNSWTHIDVGANALTIEADNGQRPCLLGNVTLTGTMGGKARFDGLLWDGRVSASGSIIVEVVDSTILARRTRAEGNPIFSKSTIKPEMSLSVRIERSIVGGIRLSRNGATLMIEDSIVDSATNGQDDTFLEAPSGTMDVAMSMVLGTADGQFALRGFGTDAPNQAAAPATIARTTLLGGVNVAWLSAKDTLFTQTVHALSAHGSLQYCYVPPNSRVPHMYHSVQSYPGPLFSSTRYGDPAYCQLDGATSPQILEGASNGSEMGAFQCINANERRKNLEHILNSYVPLTLNPKIFYVT